MRLAEWPSPPPPLDGHTLFFSVVFTHTTMAASILSKALAPAASRVRGRGGVGQGHPKFGGQALPSRLRARGSKWERWRGERRGRLREREEEPRRNLSLCFALRSTTLSAHAGAKEGLLHSFTPRIRSSASWSTRWRAVGLCYGGASGARAGAKEERRTAAAALEGVSRMRAQPRTRSPISFPCGGSNQAELTQLCAALAGRVA